MITQAALESVLHYDPVTGIFTWIKSTAKKVKVGDKAGTLCNGYRCIRLFNRRYNASWLAHLYMEGKFPVDQVDHINHVRDDNRWVNLRQVTNQGNMKNSTLRTDNTSGIVGVSWCKIRKGWLAMITHNQRQRYLGMYPSKQQAGMVRKMAELMYGFHPNHGMDK